MVFFFTCNISVAVQGVGFGFIMPLDRLFGGVIVYVAFGSAEGD